MAGEQENLHDLDDESVTEEDMIELDNIEEEEDLTEFKSSFGDPSEVPEPVAKKAGKRRGDKMQGDSKSPDQGSSKVKTPGTKVGAINAVVSNMKEMSLENIKNIFPQLAEILEGDLDDDADDVVEEVEGATIARVTAEDLDVDSDIDALFGDDDLSEEFKEKAATVYKAALVAGINEQIAKIENKVENNIQLTQSSLDEQTKADLSSYLDYVVNEWVEDNQLAIESGIRAEMVESFLGGMRSLFNEHWVDIPEGKEDVLEELVARVEELETDLNEQTNTNIRLTQSLKEHNKQDVFESLADDLTMVQAEKFKSLAEGVEFTDAKSFAKRLSVVKETYFGGGFGDDDTPGMLSEEVELENLDEEFETVGPMDRYTKAISRTSKS